LEVSHRRYIYTMKRIILCILLLVLMALGVTYWSVFIKASSSDAKYLACCLGKDHKIHARLTESAKFISRSNIKRVDNAIILEIWTTSVGNPFVKNGKSEVIIDLKMERFLQIGSNTIDIDKLPICTFPPS
jgi:hypothetical protein